MKRDLGIIRELLLSFEAHPSSGLIEAKLPTDRYGYETVHEHLRLMKESGLIQAETMRGMDGLQVVPIRILNDGYDLLDTIRNDTVWRKTADFVKDKGGGASIAAIVAIAKRFAAEQFGVDIP